MAKALSTGVLNSPGTKCSPMKLTIPIPSLSSLGGGVDSSSSADGHRGAPKSPVTVQDWVNSIDLCDDKTEDYAETTVAVEVATATETEDNLGLGDEAHHWRVGEEADCVDRMPAHNEGAARTFQAELGAPEKRDTFLQSKSNNRSLQSELSALSGSSISSVETLLESRRDDPEQLLLGLGFGGGSDTDPADRVPKRFLNRSMVRGNDVDEFLKRQQDSWDSLDVGSCGYLGLCGVRFDECPPSGIVRQLLTKMKENERRALNLAPCEVGPACHMRLVDVAFSVMAANTFRSALRPGNGRKEDSILAPENREFLENQEKKGAEEGERRRRRVILGRDSFSIDVDGQLVHVGEVTEPLTTRRLASLIADEVPQDEAPCQEAAIEETDHAPPKTAAARRALRLRKQAQVASCVDAEEGEEGPAASNGPQNSPDRETVERGAVRVDSFASNSSGFLEGDQSTVSTTQPFRARGSRSLPDRLEHPEGPNWSSNMASSSSALECPGECSVIRFCKNQLRSMRLACERLDERIVHRLPGQGKFAESILDDGEGARDRGDREGVADVSGGPVAENAPLEVQLRKIKSEVMAETRQLLFAERLAIHQELQEFRANISAIRTGLSALLSILDRHWTVAHVE